MNEDTMLQGHQMANDADNIQPVENNRSDAWKEVSLGGVIGIFMGAGAMYASGLSAKSDDEQEAVSEEQVSVADVDNELSFGEAFAAARAEVGPGGVFYWHGGIYNTFTAEEWDSMSQGQRNEFAHQVRPEILPNKVQTPTDNHPDIVVHHVEADDVSVASDPTTDDGEVHIVGYANVQGHLAVGVDMTGDGDADIAIIDVDDNRVVSDPDVVVDRQGNIETVGEIIHGTDPTMENYTDNPVTPDTDSADTDILLFDC